MPLVGAFFVEVAQVIVDFLPGLGHCLVGAPVDFFLLEAAPNGFADTPDPPGAMYYDCVSLRFFTLPAGPKHPLLLS